jgi:hypothetical protein
MTAATPPTSGDSFLTTPDFSLVLGGPLYQLWRGTRLADDAMEMLQRRILTMAAVAWVAHSFISDLSWPATGERLNSSLFERYRKQGGTVVLFSNTEEMIRTIVAHPLVMIASY